MFKKLGLLLINTISLIYYFSSMFIYIDTYDNTFAHYMFHNGFVLSVISLLLIIVLMIFNCLTLNGNKFLCKEDKSLKLGSSIILYSLNIISLILVIYCILALKHNWIMI